MEGGSPPLPLLLLLLVATGVWGSEASLNITNCTLPPCPIVLDGTAGITTASGVDSRSGRVFDAGQPIKTPFESSYTAAQDGILAELGCNPASLGHIGAGVDVITAEQLIAARCSVQLPRVNDSRYISLVDECGGHVDDHQLHEGLSCLYSESGTHSSQVGKAADGTGLYGKWEDYSVKALPALDACGAHFGVTPESNGVSVYHYHVQDLSPFTFGCYGPSSTGGPVSFAECKALYPGRMGCDGVDVATLQLAEGDVQYDRWCPCFDAWGLNVGDGSAPSPSTPPTPPVAPSPPLIPVPTLPPSTPPNPAPDLQSCTNLKSESFCRLRVHKCPRIAHKCMGTCSQEDVTLCDKIHNQCLDVVKSNRCNKWYAKGKCHKWRMRTLCAATCGSCTPSALSGAGLG